MKREVIALIIITFLGLFIIRAFSAREIDDVSPGITCDAVLLEKSDVLWIIPEYNNHSIADNQTWCKEILALNKTLGLHGVYHEYKEFDIKRNEEYLERGIQEFKACFGYEPEMFKPPQLAISQDNKNLVMAENMDVKTYANQIIHKVYHCSDTGRFSNRFIRIF